MWVERRFEGDRRRASSSTRRPGPLRQAAAARAASRRCGSRSACGPASPSSATSRRSQTLWAEVVRALGFGPWEWFWVLFYGLATYGNAGYLREQVCKYMCPYARFQSAMFDRDTLIISYDAARGEPRGSRRARRRPGGGRHGRLHRLHAVRAGLPDRHRHPQGPAVRMHRLRRLHRRLRRRDGQDALPARPDPLRDPERHASSAGRGARCGSACCGRACWSTAPCCVADRRRLRRQPGAARAVQGRRRARPRRARAPGRRTAASRTSTGCS